MYYCILCFCNCDCVFYYYTTNVHKFLTYFCRTRRQTTATIRRRNVNGRGRRRRSKCDNGRVFVVSVTLRFVFEQHSIIYTILCTRRARIIRPSFGLSFVVVGELLLLAPTTKTPTFFFVATQVV